MEQGPSGRGCLGSDGPPSSVVGCTRCLTVTCTVTCRRLTSTRLPPLPRAPDGVAGERGLGWERFSR